MVPWSQLSNGKPVAALDPTQVLRFDWILPWNGASSPQYNVDITVDNLAFY
jgi:hypothetical protein